MGPAQWYPDSGVHGTIRQFLGSLRPLLAVLRDLRWKSQASALPLEKSRTPPYVNASAALQHSASLLFHLPVRLRGKQGSNGEMRADGGEEDDQGEGDARGE